MNEKYIQKLIQLVEDSDIESLEVSSWGSKIRIDRNRSGKGAGSLAEPNVIHHVAPPPPPGPPPPPPAGAQSAETYPAKADSTEDDSRFVPIKSPMVGTFYAAPAPDADQYVSLNQKISAGQVVCIVEAMKLMNEIESEVSGRVAKILVQNAEPVEFGTTLFLIEPD